MIARLCESAGSCRGTLWMLILMWGLPLAGTAGAQDPDLRPMVQVAVIEMRTITSGTEYVGHVEAIQQVDLRARVEGVLEKINFTEGEFVRQGAILFQIEPDLYQVEVQARKAMLQQATAEQNRAGQHLRRLREARPESIPATDLDNAVAQELIAQSQVASARAALTRAELNLAYTTITAPISGRIGRTAYTRGNLVTPESGPLARIIQTDPVRVVYSVPENDLESITAALAETRENDDARVLAPRIRLDRETLLPEIGRMAFVDNQVDPATGTLAVRAEFDNPDSRLIPGQYVTVVITSREPESRIMVPQKAVLASREGHSVLIVDDKDTVVSRTIVIGPANEGFWVVASGLSPGERVIVQGLQKVKPGDRVQVSTP